MATFDRIAGVAVDGKQESSKHASWWEYTIFLILRTGKRIRVSDGVRDANQRQNKVAAHLAEVLDVHFWPGIKEQRLKVRVDRMTGKVSVTRRSGPGTVTVIALGLVAVLAVFVLGLAAFAALR